MTTFRRLPTPAWEPITAARLEQMQRDGTNARALGRTELDNPYYQRSCLPATTGEPAESWTRKAEAWHLGWATENALQD